MLKDDALEIINAAIKASLPYEKTAELLRNIDLPEKGLYIFSIGKAAVPMAKAAEDILGDRIKTGLVVTKYKHTGSTSFRYLDVIEAAHPVSDGNSILGAEKALELADSMNENDVAVVLLSGGGSAVFEKSRVSPELQRDITKKLLARGAEIEEINAIRRRLSLVKGGRFASRIYPARVITIALSDVLSNDRSVIAGGITVRDETDDEFVEACVRKYLYDIPGNELSVLFEKDEVRINDGGFLFAGDINTLCEGAVKKAIEKGYSTVCVSRRLTGEAREKAVEILGKIDLTPGRRAYIFGGETTVTLRGSGKGGRNQEMALSASILLRNSENTVFASVGSDGTDGPTDAAGGMVDGDTYCRIKAAGLDPEEELRNNNSYEALKAAGALVVTGPTGTNVNDITIILTDIK